MAKDLTRSRRVGDQIQRILSTIIQSPIREAGLGLVTISAVELSPDLAHAKVFITSLSLEHNDEQEIKLDNASNQNAILELLNNSAAYFRSQLAGMLATRIVPELLFTLDESLMQANRLTSLIDSLNRTTPDSAQ